MSRYRRSPAFRPCTLSTLNTSKLDAQRNRSFRTNVFIRLASVVQLKGPRPVLLTPRVESRIHRGLRTVSCRSPAGY